jgi:hypothetical protein
MPTLEEQLHEYGEAVTGRRRPVDVDALLREEPELLPTIDRRSRSRRAVVVAAAVGVVLIVAGVLVVRSRVSSSAGIDVGPAAGGDPGALHDLRTAVDATSNARSFTATQIEPGATYRSVYQAPDRVHITTIASETPTTSPPIPTGPLVTPPGASIPEPSLPPVPLSPRIETIDIATTYYIAQPDGSWSVLAMPAGTGGSQGTAEGGAFNIVRSAITATRTVDGFRWATPESDGSAVVRDGFVVEIVLHDPARPTYSNDPNEPTGTAPEQTSTIEFTDINSSPPVEPPPADEVHPSATVPTCPPPPQVPADFPCNDVSGAPPTTR